MGGVDNVRWLVSSGVRAVSTTPLEDGPSIVQNNRGIERITNRKSGKITSGGERAACSFSGVERVILVGRLVDWKPWKVCEKKN